MKFSFFAALICLSNLALASINKQIKQAYLALQQYDYFKAKKIFYSINSKEIRYEAALGLSIIYQRNDNPFSNSDSATKYINIANEKRNIKSKSFISINLDSLVSVISEIQFEKANRQSSIWHWDKFLKENFLCSQKLRQMAIVKRDELEFNETLLQNSSMATRQFLILHPISNFCKEAKSLFEFQIFDEQTRVNTADSYIDFIKKFPNNRMIETAYEKLFRLLKKNRKISDLAFYVKNYPKSFYTLEAWKLLFELSVAEYNHIALSNFINQYPDFPLKNSILKDLELRNLNLFSFHFNDSIGYINESAQIVIHAVYDEAKEFSEGLAVVSKNDSVFFINKENSKMFGQFFTDAFSFANGIAAVKKEGQWFFINHLGEKVSNNFEEINELTENFYICKLNQKYGALNEYGQLVIEPKYDHLRPLKNSAFVFEQGGKYGFLNKQGKPQNVLYDWLSDFDENKISICKRNNKFGLITQDSSQLLYCNYDQILKANQDCYLIIDKNFYGFFNKLGCFETQIIYDYSKENQIDFYCDEKHFKLQKKSEQTLMNKNGILEIPFGKYQEINFRKSNLHRAKRKEKFGYIDKKQNIIIPFKYKSAEDFNNGLAIVFNKDKYCVIDTLGNSIFCTEKNLKLFSKKYFREDNDEDESFNILSLEGQAIFEKIIQAQLLSNGKLLIQNTKSEFIIIEAN